LDIFSYKCDLLKCSCLDFCRDSKRNFVTSNAYTLQSAWWKILKFFPHLWNLAYYKILRLHVSKNVFYQKFATCPRNGSFGVFWWKCSQKPLGVKHSLVICSPARSLVVGSLVFCPYNEILFHLLRKMILNTRSRL